MHGDAAVALGRQCRPDLVGPHGRVGGLPAVAGILGRWGGFLVDPCESAEVYVVDHRVPWQSAPGHPDRLSQAHRPFLRRARLDARSSPISCVREMEQTGYLPGVHNRHDPLATLKRQGNGGEYVPGTLCAVSLLVLPGTWEALGVRLPCVRRVSSSPLSDRRVCLWFTRGFSTHAALASPPSPRTARRFCAAGYNRSIGHRVLLLRHRGLVWPLRGGGRVIGHVDGDVDEATWRNGDFGVCA